MNCRGMGVLGLSTAMPYLTAVLLLLLLVLLASPTGEDWFE